MKNAIDSFFFSINTLQHKKGGGWGGGGGEKHISTIKMAKSLKNVLAWNIYIMKIQYMFLNMDGF